MWCENVESPGGTIEDAAEIGTPTKIPERQPRERSFVFFKLGLHHSVQMTMKILHSRPLGLLRSMLLLFALSLSVPTQALYFYLEGTTPKCFYEELPKDTLVVGKYNPSISVPAPSESISRPLKSRKTYKK